MSDRFQVDDAVFAERLWSGVGGLRDLLLGDGGGGGGDGGKEEGKWGGEVVGLSPKVRVYRYGKGGYFGCHCRSLFLFCGGGRRGEDLFFFFWIFLSLGMGGWWCEFS